jgi:DNA modification methylase
VREDLTASNGLAKRRRRMSAAPLSPAERAMIERFGARPIIRVPIDWLRPSTGHARRHSKAKIMALAASIRRFGIVEPILANRDLTIISGVALWLACQQLGIAEVPVLSVEHLRPIEVRALRIAMGRFPEWATWDREQLRIELPAIAAELPDLAVTEIGFSVTDVNRLIASPGKRDADRADDIPPHCNAPPITRIGDLWKLGHNLVLCGDPLDAASYERILASTAVRLVLTDPPYRALIEGRVAKATGRFATPNSGTAKQKQLRGSLDNVFRHIARVSIGGAIAYIFVDWRHSSRVQDAARAVLFELKDHVVWAKNESTPDAFYQSQHEFVLVYKVSDGEDVNNFARGQYSRTRSNVWQYPAVSSFEIGRDEAVALCAPPKPVAMLADAILDCSNDGDLVLDPFGGLGSTLIAAEQAQRRARLIEISPSCVDIIVRRWQRFSGDQAVLAGSNQTFSEIMEVRARRGAAAAVRLRIADGGARGRNIEQGGVDD